MDLLTSDFKTALQEYILTAQEELKGIRTGRANSGMIENITVEAYGGTKMKLRDISSITAEGPATIVVVPFDQSTITDIEKSILSSPLGFSPQTEGHKIYIRIPPLSEEQRAKYTKLAGQLVEDIKNMVRRERDDMRKRIKRMFDDKEIPEDTKFRYEKNIDTVTTDVTNKLQDLREMKEQEIMEV